MLYSKLLDLIVLAVTVTAQHPKRPRAPGVGFVLTPDYGIASIYLKDGSHVPIAQIQGSQQYQEFMRKSTVPPPTKQDGFCQYLSPALEFLPSSFTSTLTACRGSDSGGTQDMLAALKAAVESYLGTNICFASLSLDDAEGSKSIVAQDALHSTGLRQVMPTVLPAKLIAYGSRPPQAPAYDEKPWPFLTVDYSRQWYNVGLYTIGEKGVIDPVDGFIERPTVDRQDQLESLKETLSRMISQPPVGYDLPQELRHVMVNGDDADSSDLRAQLTEILGPDLTHNANISQSIYDVANILARNSHIYMDTVDFEMSNKAAFGCQWRSRLYLNDSSEL